MPLDFLAIAESSGFLDFARIVWQLTGVASAIYDADLRRMTSVRAPLDAGPLCTLIWSASGAFDRCEACNREACARAVDSGHPLSYTCHAGLIDFIVPVFSGSRLVANIMGGQILPSQPSNRGFRAFLEHNRDLHMDPNKAREAYFQSAYLPKAAIHALVQLFSFFAEHSCRVEGQQREVDEQHKADAVSRARDYVDAHHRENVSLETVAAEVGFSPSYFSVRFKKGVGIGFRDYLQQRRVATAKRELSRSRDSITAIAFEAGFNSISQFNRVFRKLEHCSPSDYRKRVWHLG